MYITAPANILKLCFTDYACSELATSGRIIFAVIKTEQSKNLHQVITQHRDNFITKVDAVALAEAYLSLPFIAFFIYSYS